MTLANTKTTAPMVREALGAHLERCAAKGLAMGTGTRYFYDAVLKNLDADFRGMNTWQRHAAERKLAQQVLAALNHYAAKGVLVRHGERHGVRFYTPAQGAAMEKEREEAREAARMARARVTAVKKRLTALGIDLRDSHYPVQLGESAWEKLLDLAENGKALVR